MARQTQAKFYLLFFAILSLVNISLTTSDLCPRLIKESNNEEEIINSLSTNIHEIKNYTNQCVESLLRSGNFKALEYLLNELNNRGIKFRESLSVAINNLQRKLEDLHNKFRFDESDFQKVTPAFQWAQSMDHIFLEIKFAHRHDSPGCLEVNNESVEIYKNLVIFKAYCVLGDVPIKFQLSLELWQEVSSEESTYGFGSVGRYTVTLKKKMGGMYWDKLLKEGSDVPGNMKVWWEMREKYIDQIQQYLDDDEEEEFKRQTEKMEKKAREKKKKKKSQKAEKAEKTNLEKTNESPSVSDETPSEKSEKADL